NPADYRFDIISGIGLPDIDVQLSDNSACPGEEITVVASGGFQNDYSWSAPAGEESSLSDNSGEEITITLPNTPGDYEYEVASGCFDKPGNSTTFTVTVEPCSIDELEVHDLDICGDTANLNDAIDNASGTVEWYTDDNGAPS